MVIEGVLELHAVSMGNPHCVVFVDSPTAELARQFGPLIELLTLFPGRTNVQLVRVLNRQQIEMQIWERGVGYTLSSGTSSCAAQRTPAAPYVCYSEPRAGDQGAA